MNILNKIKESKQYFIFGVGQMMNLIVPILVAPFLIRKCGIENFGKVGVVTSVYLLFSLFIDFGSFIIGVKEISTNKDNKAFIKKYLETVFGLKFIIFIIFFIIIIISVIILHNQIDVKLYIYSIPILFAQVINPSWIYQGYEEFNKNNYIIFFSKSIYILLILVIIQDSEDYLYALLLLGLANTFTYLHFFLKVCKVNKLSFQAISKIELKNEFLTNYPMVLSNFFISIYTNSPIIIVKIILGDFAAGIYKIADMFLAVFRSYLSVFFNVSFPKFCILYAQSIEQGMSYIKKINIINTILLVVSISSLYFISSFYISYYCFDKELISTISYCRNFLFIPIIIAVNIPFYQILIYNNKQKEISKINFISAVLMIMICYLLTSYFNTNGTILSIYISESVTTLLLIYLYYNKILKK